MCQVGKYKIFLVIKNYFVWNAKFPTKQMIGNDFVTNLPINTGHSDGKDKNTLLQGRRILSSLNYPRYVGWVEIISTFIS